MILLIDNYDSFSYNLFQLIGSLNPDIKVIRNDAASVKEIEEMTEKVYPTIHIVGGGANAEYLNRLTAESTGKAIHTGPTEATAIGNLTAQMLQDNVFSSVAEARNCIHDSFQIKVIEP